MTGFKIFIIVSLAYYDRFLRCHRKCTFSMTLATMTPEYLL